jgi:ATP-binding cassette, subfamily B, bacterial
MAQSMSSNGSLAKRSDSTASAGSLHENGRWALSLTWGANRSLTAAFIAMNLMQGVVPAVQAIATRGLINSALRGINDHGTSLRVVLPWLLVALAATIADALSRLFRDFASQRLEDDLNLELNARILEHTAKLEVGFFEDPASQDMLYCAKQNGAKNLLRFVGSLLSFLSNLVQMASLLAILAVIEPLVLLLAPTAVPYLWFQWNLSEIRHELEKSRATKRRWTQYFVSSLTEPYSVPEVKILDLAPLMIARFRALMREFRDQDHHLLVRALRAAGLFSTAATIALFVLFARVALRVLAGASTIGDLAIFGAAAGRLRATLEGQVNAVAVMREETLNISDLRELLLTHPAIVAAPNAIAPENYRGEIEFRGVSFTYPGSDQPALRDVSLTIRPGETLALVGENGSGKSTLVKLLARLYDPVAGSVRLDGHDLRELDPEHLRSQISLVFQNYHGYEATFTDNIAYGDWQRLMGQTRQIEAIAHEAGLADLIESLPGGFETLLGRRFGQFDLSRGQWQRVAIARAFSRRSSLVILDEPTSSLDLRAERDLLSRFRALVRGRTAIVVAHRLSTLEIATRIAVMQHGRIIELGSHEELLRKGGEYASLHARSQSSGRFTPAISS